MKENILNFLSSRSFQPLLMLLAALTVQGQTDKSPTGGSTTKTAAKELISQFNAFWTPEDTKPVRIPPTLKDVH